MNCAYCLKEITKPQSELNKKRNNYFCGVACYYLFQRKRVDKVCEICGKSFQVPVCNDLKGIGRTCSRECHYKYQSIRKQITGKNHHCYKGGRNKQNGYIRIRKSKTDRKLEHRIIMEKYLGIKIPETFIVHHIDANRSNNNINNLAIMTGSAHARLHHILRKLNKSVV